MTCEDSSQPSTVIAHDAAFALVASPSNEYPGLLSKLRTARVAPLDNPADALASQAVTVEAGLSILVVDDEFNIVELLAELLEARGHRVTTAINGLIATSLLHSNDYDLVITDFMMPIVDGITLVQGMRASPRLAAVPVIMASAQYDVIATAGAELVQVALRKPFAARALYAAIDRCTSLRARSAR